MADIILKCENISKQYRLGTVGTGTLSHDINRWWHKVRGKEDPYLKIGDSNDRSKTAESAYVWALKDINFEVKRGEVLGIIGKNGAGKSTLLKILSRVTSPTTGIIKTKGRIASLLEVGTGFHPEMTGRENIFLNGAILGMTKAEIKAKLDEIIDFSGCARYIDTPVKRYSSGMRVRLAFAVAAFLEPDILVVDEVLAVGDAEFQKKAIGKMQDISQGDGRTVLFVSHNMATINKLCSRCILLSNGSVKKVGHPEKVVPYYLSESSEDKMITEKTFEINSSKNFQVISVKIMANKEVRSNGIFSTKDDLFVSINYLFNIDVSKCHLTLIIKNSLGEIIYFLDRTDFHSIYFKAEKGGFEARIKIPNPMLKAGIYYLSVGLADQHSNENDHKFDIIKFSIEDIDGIRQTREGHIFYPLKWEMIKIN